MSRYYSVRYYQRRSHSDETWEQLADPDQVPSDEADVMWTSKAEARDVRKRLIEDGYQAGSLVIIEHRERVVT